MNNIRKAGIVLFTSNGIEERRNDLVIALTGTDAENKDTLEELAVAGFVIRYDEKGVESFMAGKLNKGIPEISTRTIEDLDLISWLKAFVPKGSLWLVPAQEALVVPRGKGFKVFFHREYTDEGPQDGEAVRMAAFDDQEDAVKAACILARNLVTPRVLTDEQMEKLGRKNKYENGWNNVAVTTAAPKLFRQFAVAGGEWVHPDIALAKLQQTTVIRSSRGAIRF